MCRVEGEFPEGELVCEEPILVVSFKIGVCRVDPKGKECRTVFQRLRFNGKTSVVRCLPLTGRTHQIRVHLQYLGFPILNDPIYGSSAWGPHRGKGGMVGKSDEELLLALVEEHRSQESLHLLDIPDDGTGILEKTDKLAGSSEPDQSGQSCQSQMGTCGSNKKLDTQVPEDCSSTAENNDDASPRQLQGSEQSKANGSESEATDAPLQSPSGTRDHLCSECKLVRPDPTEKELVMFLHALRYKGPDFEYSSPLPDWAKDDWVEAD